MSRMGASASYLAGHRIEPQMFAYCSQAVPLEVGKGPACDPKRIIGFFWGPLRQDTLESVKLDVHGMTGNGVVFEDIDYFSGILLEAITMAQIAVGDAVNAGSAVVDWQDRFEAPLVVPAGQFKAHNFDSGEFNNFAGVLAVALGVEHPYSFIGHFGQASLDVGVSQTDPLPFNR